METWRAIPGYEGLYEVSNLGRVRSLPRYVEGRILSVNKRNGYSSAVLSVAGRGRKTLGVHRLVAKAFIGSVEGLQVNHKDFDKQNNTVENLEIVTGLDNIRHSLNAGRGQVGEGHHRARLRREDVLNIRKHGESGVLTTAEMAFLYEVGNSTIQKIRTYKIWRRV